MTTIHVQTHTFHATTHTATVAVGDIEHAIELPFEPYNEPSVDIADNGDIIVTYIVNDDHASYDDMMRDSGYWGTWELLRGSVPCIGTCECGSHISEHETVDDVLRCGATDWNGDPLPAEDDTYAPEWHLGEMARADRVRVLHGFDSYVWQGEYLDLTEDNGTRSRDTYYLIEAPSDIDAKNLASFWDALLSEYNAIGAGEVYGIVQVRYMPATGATTDESVWGIGGTDYAESELKMMRVHPNV